MLWFLRFPGAIISGSVQRDTNLIFLSVVVLCSESKREPGQILWTWNHIRAQRYDSDTSIRLELTLVLNRLPR